MFHDTCLAWPDGRTAALTTSWDDGQSHDRRLVEIFNPPGVKGTFNLNSAKLLSHHDPEGSHLSWEELPSLFEGHEIALHTANHPWLQLQPPEGVVAEVMRDRARLEAAAGGPVKGMALPFGTYSPRTLEILAACGVLHCRTVRSTGGFELPDDFLEWHPTCHQAAEDLFSLLERVAKAAHRRAQLFYVWGHSYEFPRDDSWERIERFAAKAGGDGRIWHATNWQVMNYLLAWRGLRWTVDGQCADNPSATTVWVNRGGRALRLPAGTRTRLDD